jgi:hypothetical protein
MTRLTGTVLILLLHGAFLLPHPLVAADRPSDFQNHTDSTSSVWQTDKAEHVYGLPEIKHNKKGRLVLSTDTLTFTGQSGNVSIPRDSITAVSAGNERVEIWGVGGRILRMTIPNGGGLAAATVMHHRIDMLTVEFRDTRGGDHGAVFFLPANEAESALKSFALTPAPQRLPADSVCHDSPLEPGSVLVSTPNWDHVTVPAAYRALMYEHVVDRLRQVKDIGRVYREGEVDPRGRCPQYNIHISLETFKEGSSVKRAFMGPAGFFVGTTQMVFQVTFTDAAGTLNINEQIKATIRGESESTNVADNVAKNLSKHYATALKNAAKSRPGKVAVTPYS